jgi:hypothetical protein
MDETSTLRRYSGKEEPYLRGVGNAESENEPPSEDIREPVMRLRSGKRVSGPIVPCRGGERTGVHVDMTVFERVGVPPCNWQRNVFASCGRPVASPNRHTLRTVTDALGGLRNFADKT